MKLVFSKQFNSVASFVLLPKKLGISVSPVATINDIEKHTLTLAFLATSNRLVNWKFLHKS